MLFVFRVLAASVHTQEDTPDHEEQTMRFLMHWLFTRLLFYHCGYDCFIWPV